MKKRLLSFLLAICLLAGCLPLSASAATQDDAITWLNSKMGKGIDYDGAYGCQCVDLIFAYYNFLGVRPVGGNAADYRTNALPAGWQRIKYSQGFVPKPGDVAVFNPGVSGVSSLGHVGVVMSATTSSYTTAEQNVDGKKYVQKVTRTSSKYNMLWGVLRPSFNSTSGKVTVSTKAAENIMATSATLKGTVKVEGAKTTSVGIQMGTSLSNTPQVIGKNVASSNYTLTYEAKNLSPNTTYYYRMGTCINGEFYFADYKSFTTLGDTTVTLSYNTGVPSTIKSQTKTSTTASKTFTISSAKPTKSGYSFLGWATSSTATSAKYQPGGTIKINKNTTLYAVWKKKDTAVTLSYSTGVSTSIKSQSKTDTSASKTFTISSAKPTKSGYTFLGWATSSTATSAKYQPGGTITISKDTTLYAVWKKKDAAVTLSFSTGTSETIAPVTKTDANAKKTFTIPSTELKREGCTFLGWAASSEAKIAEYRPGASITIEKDITLYAVWKKDSTFQLSYYYYSGSTKNGYEEKSSEEIPCRFVVRSPEETRKGYLFKGWSWNKNSTIPEYQPGDIVEIEEDRILYAVWESDGTISFEDVTEGAYYYDAVDWAVENGVTNGTGDNKFSPGDGCTRAQAVTFLWRAAGSPEPMGFADGFSDVNDGAYYAKAVQWAREQEITGGVGGNQFGANERCSRAQIVTFLYRAAGSPATSGESSFGDVGAGDYYKDAVDWAIANGITNGTGDNKFSPKDTCSRGQIVTFLYRYAG